MAFEALADKGVQFVPGQVCLIAAGGGTGKSAFTLTYALRADKPTLYFSPDSDAYTQCSRVVSILSGKPLKEAEAEYRRGFTDPVADQAKIRFDFRNGSLDDIELRLEAYEELAGDFPAIIVFDNITNITGKSDSGDPFDGLEGLLTKLHNLGRNTGSFIIGLHHVTAEYADGDKPVPMSGVKGQVSRIPEIILTLHRVNQTFGSDTLKVSVVKNRNGRADSTGRDTADLEFIGDTVQIRDYPRS